MKLNIKYYSFILFASSDKTDWKRLSLDEGVYDFVVGKREIGNSQKYNYYRL